MIGDLKITRKFINSEGNDPFFFTYHTNLRDTKLFDEDLKATIAIVHGFGENSDIFLESAILYALNGFDVHLIDLRGYGLTGGPRMNTQGIAEYHRDVTCLLQQVNPKLPLFIYGHSMGGLTITSYLTNNPHIKVSGVILSAPFLGFNPSKKIDQTKKTLVSLLAPHLEVSI